MRISTGSSTYFPVVEFSLSVSFYVIQNTLLFTSHFLYVAIAKHSLSLYQSAYFVCLIPSSVVRLHCPHSTALSFLNDISNKICCPKDERKQRKRRRISCNCQRIKFLAELCSSTAVQCDRFLHVKVLCFYVFVALVLLFAWSISTFSIKS